MTKKLLKQTANPARVIKKVFPWIVCALGAVFYAYEYFLRITPNVMTNELMSSYDIGALALGNLAAFYYYAYTPMQLPVGVLMDRFGPRRLLTLACLACAVGSYMFASTHQIVIAGLGRFLVGFGSAFAFVGVLKLATIWLPPNRFGMIAGMASALGAIGAFIGEILLEKLVETIDWRNTVLLTAVAGIILALIISLLIRDRRKTEDVERVDIRWSEVMQGFLTIMRNKYIWINGLIGCFLYLPASVFAELWGKSYLQATHDFSGGQAAWGISLVFIGFAIGGPIFGYVSDRIGNRNKPMMLGGIFATIFFCGILYMPNLSIYAVDVLLLFFGVSYGAQVIVFAVGRELSPRHAAATAVAVINFVVMLSGFVFQPLVGALLNLGWDGVIKNHLHIYSASDYTMAMSVVPACLLLGVICIRFLKETNGVLLDDAAQASETQEQAPLLSNETLA